MRKILFSVLMIPLLLLAGCGEREVGPEGRFAALREALLSAERVTFTAAITVDRGGTMEEFTISASWDGQETTMEITEPALLAGIRAAVKWGEGMVSYEDVMLSAGPVDENGLTPVSAAPAFLAALAGGRAELFWRDGEHPAARIFTGEGTTCTVWLDTETEYPVAAEFDAGGRRVISCEITDWTLTPGETPAKE